MTISITLYELPFCPALSEYWPSHICDFNELDDYVESSDYDDYELYEPIDNFLSSIALASGGACLDYTVLDKNDQFEYVLKVLESKNPITSFQEPNMISIYSNNELKPMIISLLNVKLKYVDEEWHENVRSCLITMIGFLSRCNMNGHAVAV